MTVQSLQLQGAFYLNRIKRENMIKSGGNMELWQQKKGIVQSHQTKAKQSVYYPVCYCQHTQLKIKEYHEARTAKQLRRGISEISTYFNEHPVLSYQYLRLFFSSSLIPIKSIHWTQDEI